MDISITSGETGENLVETNYDGDLSRVSPVSRWMEVVPGPRGRAAVRHRGLAHRRGPSAGRHRGRRRPSSLELGEDDSAVAVIDIRKVYPAEGGGRAPVQRRQRYAHRRARSRRPPGHHRPRRRAAHRSGRPDADQGQRRRGDRRRSRARALHRAHLGGAHGVRYDVGCRAEVDRSRHDAARASPRLSPGRPSARRCSWSSRRTRRTAIRRRVRSRRIPRSSSWSTSSASTSPPLPRTPADASADRVTPAVRHPSTVSKGRLG